MKIQGAIVTEQGITFAIVIVKPSAMQTQLDSDRTRQSCQAQIAMFSGLPLILASQDSFGVFSYQGKPDIVGFLASIDPARIPWMEYTLV